jgi:glycosyl transferase family 2
VGGAALPVAIRARRWALDRLGWLGTAVRAARRHSEQLDDLSAEQRRTRALAEQLQAEITKLALMIEAVVESSRESAQSTQESKQAINEAGQAVNACAEAIKETAQAIQDVDRRLRATQALTARTYEQTQDWKARLEEGRLAEDYELAYEDSPLITVRIPTYNRAQVLCERALASLRRQTYEHWEALVIGDACDDDTEDRVRAIGDPRIYFENLPVRGPYPEDQRELWMVAGKQPTLRAEALAKGQWVAPLDDDDEWDDDHLDALLGEARRSHAEIVYGKWRIGDASNGRLVQAEGGAWPLQKGHFASQCAIFHRCLRGLHADDATRLADEPGDWNRVRRLWEAEARFAFVDRPVATIWYTPRHADGRQWFEGLKDSVGYAD